MTGSSDERDEARRVEHVVPLAEWAEGIGVRNEEGWIGRHALGVRVAPGPGSQPSFERAGRDRRCPRLLGAPGPRAGAARRGHRRRIGSSGEVADQGFDQRAEPGRIVPGPDEMRALSLRGRGRRQGERQERCDGSRRREGQTPGPARSRHGSGLVERGPFPLRKGAGILRIGQFAAEFGNRCAVPVDSGPVGPPGGVEASACLTGAWLSWRSRMSACSSSAGLNR
jgi:hypothetical protein